VYNVVHFLFFLPLLTSHTLRSIYPRAETYSKQHFDVSYTLTIAKLPQQTHWCCVVHLGLVLFGYVFASLIFCGDCYQCSETTSLIFSIVFMQLLT
jgi:hypothetical protein